MSKFEELLNVGLKRDLALALSFNYLSEEEKRGITFEECKTLWGETFSPESAEKSAAWQLLIAMPKKFDETFDIWKELSPGSTEYIESWELLKNQIKSFDQCLSVWECFDDCEPTKEKAEAWQIVTQISKSFSQIERVWKYTNSPMERAEARKILIAAAKDFEEKFHLCKIGSTQEKEDAWKKLLDATKTFTKILFLWHHVYPRMDRLIPVRVDCRWQYDVWRKLLSKTETFKQAKLVYIENSFLGTLGRMKFSGFLTTLVKIAKNFNFKEVVWVWEENYDTADSKALESLWKILTAKAKTLADCQWLYENAGDDQKKADAWAKLQKLSQKKLFNFKNV